MGALENLLKNADDYREQDLFKDKTKENNLINSCIEYLKTKNYKVIPRPSETTIKNIDNIITFFYEHLDYYYDNIYSLTSNKDKDRAYVKRFINDRQSALGTTREIAIQECVAIIRALFIYKEELNLNSTPGLWIFGSDSCKWIVDKIINYINSDKEYYNRIKVERMVMEYDLNNNSYSGFDFDHLRRKYGEEENSYRN